MCSCRAALRCAVLPAHERRQPWRAMRRGYSPFFATCLLLSPYHSSIHISQWAASLHPNLPLRSASLHPWRSLPSSTLASTVEHDVKQQRGHRQAPAETALAAPQTSTDRRGSGRAGRRDAEQAGAHSATRRTMKNMAGRAMQMRKSRSFGRGPASSCVAAACRALLCCGC